MVWDPYSGIGAGFRESQAGLGCDDASEVEASALGDIVSLLAEHLGGTSVIGQRDPALVIPTANDDPDEWDDDDTDSDSDDGNVDSDDEEDDLGDDAGTDDDIDDDGDDDFDDE